MNSRRATSIPTAHQIPTYCSKDQDHSLGGRRRVDCAPAESTQDDWDRSWWAKG